MNDVPAEQVKVLSDLARSGDAAAGDWLSQSGHEPQPGNTGDVKKESNGAPVDAKPEGGPKPGADNTAPDAKGLADGEAKPGVDAHRDGAGDGGKKPSIYTEVKRLRQERRELRAQRDESRQREETLNSRLAALEAQAKSPQNGPKAAAAAEEDLLTSLLSNPDKVLAERDKRLIEAVREAFKQDMAKSRALEESRNQKSSAIKTLESIKDFDLEKDEDEVFEIMKEEYDLDEDDVEHLLATRPVKTAAWIKKAWEKKHSTAIDDSAKADKASARSGPSVGGGGTHSKSTLEGLNARAKGGRSSEDLDRLWEEAGKLSK